MADYANPHVLITTEEVAERLGDPDIHIVEIDEDTSAYDRGHLPGALMFNWTNDLQHPHSRDLLDQPAFEALLGRSGIDENTEVILYGGNNNWFAAYGYWAFKYYGHGPVRLMDGGRKKWELEGRPVTTDLPEVQPRTYRAKPADRTIRAFRDEVLLRHEGVELVDVRSPEEFSGLLVAPPHLPQEVAQRAGHIPGARNVPWSRAAREDGSFRTADELRSVYFEKAGLDETAPVVSYCRIGERSAHTWVVLHELLGLADVRNYDGSWTEYGSLVGAPIETGPSA